MCQQCSCFDIISQGPKATLNRAIAVVKELGVTADNAQRFEDGERICTLVIASKVPSGDDEEVHEIAEWVLGLHQNTYVGRSKAFARAAREVFANIPASGPAKDVITTWHLLEQLTRDLDEDALSSVDEPAVREAIRAVQRVHENPKKRLSDLLQRYQLEGI